MGKAAARKRTTTKYKGDPVLDQLTAIDARSMLMGGLVGMGWRLALMVLVPIFIGVQLDKRFDSSPSLTLAAFFVAIFGAGVLIYNTYSEINAQQAIEDARQAKRTKKRKRMNNA